MFYKILKWLKASYHWAENKALDKSPEFIKNWATDNIVAFRIIIFTLWLIPAGLTAYAAFIIAWRFLALIIAGFTWMFTIK